MDRAYALMSADYKQAVEDLKNLRRMLKEARASNRRYLNRIELLSGQKKKADQQDHPWNKRIGGGLAGPGRPKKPKAEDRGNGSGQKPETPGSPGDGQGSRGGDGWIARG
jgi:hypothetical protein